jgi:hypothetical protein
MSKSHYSNPQLPSKIKQEKELILNNRQKLINLDQAHTLDNKQIKLKSANPLRKNRQLKIQ